MKYKPVEVIPRIDAIAMLNSINFKNSELSLNMRRVLINFRKNSIPPKYMMTVTIASRLLTEKISADRIMMLPAIPAITMGIKLAFELSRNTRCKATCGFQAVMFRSSIGCM
jgi:CO dehydrogenase/acetyl-CoA synthase delta subunit